MTWSKLPLQACHPRCEDSYLGRADEAPQGQSDLHSEVRIDEKPLTLALTEGALVQPIFSN